MSYYVIFALEGKNLSLIYLLILFLVNALFSMIIWGTWNSFFNVYIDQAWELGKHTLVVGHNAVLWHFGAVTSSS